jgi:hypothetical protein
MGTRQLSKLAAQNVLADAAKGSSDEESEADVAESRTPFNPFAYLGDEHASVRCPAGFRGLQSSAALHDRNLKTVP